MEQFVKERFKETDEYLGNPHKGCCTFQHFNGQKLFAGETWSEAGPSLFPALKNRYKNPVKGYLPSTVAYCRWFWDLLEPKEGKYDFSVVDQALATAEARGQTMAVRLMAYGSHKQAQLPSWYQNKYACEVSNYKSTKQIIPIHDSPDYLEKWGDCIKAFAEKYEGDPRLETIDVSFIGPWGEGNGKCSRRQCAKFATLWKKAFKFTPRLALVEGVQLEESVKRGSGWRCDCFGDLSNTGSPTVPKRLSWNHMYDAYPRQICQANAQNAWQTAPVHFETCWVPLHWERHGFNIDFILEQGIKYHGTYFMPKYTRIPDKYLAKLAKFCRRLGYRYVFRQSRLDSFVTPGRTMHFDAWIENVGVAPIYRRYDFALKFQQADKEELIVLKDVDIRKWLPGDIWLDKEIKAPNWLQTGKWEVSAALIGPDKTPKIKFAVKKQLNAPWLSLGKIQINS